MIFFYINQNLIGPVQNKLSVKNHAILSECSLLVQTNRNKLCCHRQAGESKIYDQINKVFNLYSCFLEIVLRIYIIIDEIDLLVKGTELRT